MGERKISRAQRDAIIFIVLLGMLGATIFSWMYRRPPLHSSPTEDRNFRHPTGRKYASHPDFSFSSGKPVIDNRMKMGASGAVTVHAVALSVPGWTSNTIWRDPTSLDEIQQLQLSELGAPDWLLEGEKSGRGPVLSLLLQAEAPLAVVRARFTRAIDVRTNTPIHRLDETVEYEVNEGRWTRLAIPLSIWHDTELKIWLPMLGGEPFEQSIGAKLAPMNLDEGATDLQFADPSRFSISPEFLVGHLKTSRNRAHRGLIGRNSSGVYRTEWFWPSEPRDEVNLQTMREAPTRHRNKEAFAIGFGPGLTAETYSWIYLPDVHLFELQIPKLPEMPNGRDVENLFDVWIPEITTDDPFRAVTGAVELLDYSSTVSAMYPLPALEATYSDITPYELLHRVPEQWESRPKFVSGRFVLFAEAYVPWHSRLKTWIIEKRDGLFQ